MLDNDSGVQVIEDESYSDREQHTASSDAAGKTLAGPATVTFSPHCRLQARFGWCFFL